ncbi:hypothetical protein E2C01_069021 [Portunus trituberculatus]|uniref:Uncharacterized protein n=1 Tax=Portunus trituberculatus TaxID=210409 RepID=A0A5B7HTJ2_PORTR|nr:hypothetical protein [Portunus trituberculatus]
MKEMGEGEKQGKETCVEKGTERKVSGMLFAKGAGTPRLHLTHSQHETELARLPAKVSWRRLLQGGVPHRKPVGGPDLAKCRGPAGCG